MKSELQNIGYKTDVEPLLDHVIHHTDFDNVLTFLTFMNVVELVEQGVMTVGQLRDYVRTGVMTSDRLLEDDASFNVQNYFKVLSKYKHTHPFLAPSMVGKSKLAGKLVAHLRNSLDLNVVYKSAGEWESRSSSIDAVLSMFNYMFASIITKIQCATLSITQYDDLATLDNNNIWFDSARTAAEFTNSVYMPDAEEITNSIVLPKDIYLSTDGSLVPYSQFVTNLRNVRREFSTSTGVVSTRYYDELQRFFHLQIMLLPTLDDSIIHHFEKSDDVIDFFYYLIQQNILFEGSGVLTELNTDPIYKGIRSKHFIISRVVNLVDETLPPTFDLLFQSCVMSNPELRFASAHTRNDNNIDEMTQFNLEFTTESANPIKTLHYKSSVTSSDANSDEVINLTPPITRLLTETPLSTRLLLNRSKFVSDALLEYLADASLNVDSKFTLDDVYGCESDALTYVRRLRLGMDLSDTRCKKIDVIIIDSIVPLLRSVDGLRHTLRLEGTLRFHDTTVGDYHQSLTTPILLDNQIASYIADKWIVGGATMKQAIESSFSEMIKGISALCRALNLTCITIINPMIPENMAKTVDKQRVSLDDQITRTQLDEIFTGSTASFTKLSAHGKDASVTEIRITDRSHASPITSMDKPALVRLSKFSAKTSTFAHHAMDIIDTPHLHISSNPVIASTNNHSAILDLTDATLYPSAVADANNNNLQLRSSNAQH